MSSAGASELCSHEQQDKLDGCCHENKAQHLPWPPRGLTVNILKAKLHGTCHTLPCPNLCPQLWVLRGSVSTEPPPLDFPLLHPLPGPSCTPSPAQFLTMVLSSCIPRSHFSRSLWPSLRALRCWRKGKPGLVRETQGHWEMTRTWG